MENDWHIGKKLKQEAEAQGLKPAQVAKVFGVKPPSVYDWYEHGRIHQKHYPRLVEWSGKPITWWLDFPTTGRFDKEPPEPYVKVDHRHKVLIDLFDGLPARDQTELIKTLTEKKQHYDAVVAELSERRILATHS